MSEQNYGGRRVNVRAIIYQNGKLLAVKHRHENGKAVAYYAVPGGGLDPNESLQQGLKREIVEELGVEPVVGRLLFTQQYHTIRKGFDEELELFFAIENVDDFESLDISATSHGSAELAVCEYVDPREVEIFPRFLSTIELSAYFSDTLPVLVVDNFNE